MSFISCIVLCLNLRFFGVQRRQLWIEATGRDDLDEKNLENLRVCSDHFQSGMSSYLKNRIKKI